jgi:hypothetical protein
MSFVVKISVIGFEGKISRAIFASNSKLHTFSGYFEHVITSQSYFGVPPV